MFWRRWTCPPAAALTTTRRPKANRIGEIPVGTTVWISRHAIYRDRKGRHYFWDYQSHIFGDKPLPGYVKAERIACGWRVWQGTPIPIEDIDRRSLLWRDYTPIVEVIAE